MTTLPSCLSRTCTVRHRPSTVRPGPMQARTAVPSAVPWATASAFSTVDPDVEASAVTPMSEHVDALDLGVKWKPNAPSAILLSDDHGITALALDGHPDNPDQRCVVLVWSGTRSACLADPNDEAISRHRLFSHGLNRVMWAGAVRDSVAIRALKVQNRVHPHHDSSHFERLTHYIVLLKECVVEVVAEEISVHRFEGTTLEAATSPIAR